MREANHRVSRAMLTAALILLALSVYEVCTRLDAAWYPLKMFVNMAIGEHIPLANVLKYVDVRVFAAPLYMLGCGILAIWALFARRSRRGCTVLLVPCILMTALGFSLHLTIFGELVRALKMLPLVCLTLLCIAQLLIRPAKPVPPPPPAALPRSPGALPPAPNAVPLPQQRVRRSERHARKHR